MTREEIIMGLDAALVQMHGQRYTPEDVEELEKQAWAALELLEHSEPIINGVWRYYVNEMGKARWRCSVCGHVVKHDPNDFKRCTCGAHMSKEA